MATYLRLTAPVTLLICLPIISMGSVCATLQPNEKLSRWSQTALLASKSPVQLKTIQFVPPPPNDKKSPKKTEAGGGR